MLPNEVIATDVMPSHWAFYFQGSGLPLSVSGYLSGSRYKVHISLQEPQAVAMMLCRIALQVFSKVVALHLDMQHCKSLFM